VIAAKCAFLWSGRLLAMADWRFGNIATEFETGTNYFVEFSLSVLVWQIWSFADALSHRNDGSPCLEANFIHDCSYRVDATAVNRSDIFLGL
jgi:hypothetical protein